MFPLQTGDFLALARLAWEIYNIGWSDEQDAERQYREFFQDVKFLARHLEALNVIVESTKSPPRTRRPSSSVDIPLDIDSLKEIIGHYDETLNECVDLVRDNYRYAFGSNAAKNIAWNIVVQPRANRLKDLIAMHNQKVALVLQPFHFDILSRVQRDVKYVLEEFKRMHNEVIEELKVIGTDVRGCNTNMRRIMVAVGLEAEEASSDQQPSTADGFPDISRALAERFHTSAASDPSKLDGTGFQLEDLGDALVGHLHWLTRNFKPSPEVVQRIPSAESYINLLKCVWILGKMQESPRAKDADGKSHWPSYMDYLEEQVSKQCQSIQTEQIALDVSDPDSIGVSQKVFHIWPEKEPTPLLPVYNREEELLQLSELPLRVSEENRTCTLKLFRRLDSGGNRLRVAITGEDQTRHETETVNLHLDESTITPLYALPRSLGPSNELVITTDKISMPLAFMHEKDIFQFQRAVTGFKNWKSYYANDVNVTFVLRDAKKPTVETASIQIWIPKPAEGSPVKDKGVTREDDTMEDESMATPAMESIMEPSSPVRIAGPLTPVDIQTSSSQLLTNIGHNIRHASSGRTPTSPAKAINSSSTSTTDRTDQVSNMISISHELRNPQLVLFTHSSGDSPKRYTMAIKINNDTKVKPERCDCRKNEKQCCTVAIEPEKERNLTVRRWEAGNVHGVSEWNIALLADAVASDVPRTTRGDTDWDKVKRISIEFDTIEERRKFGGSPCNCKRELEAELKQCLKDKHQGLWGEVREWYRMKYDEWHKHRWGRHPSVFVGAEGSR